MSKIYKFVLNGTLTRTDVDSLEEKNHNICLTMIAPIDYESCAEITLKTSKHGLNFKASTFIRTDNE